MEVFSEIGQGPVRIAESMEEKEEGAWVGCGVAQY